MITKQSILMRWLHRLFLIFTIIKITNVKCISQQANLQCDCIQFESTFGKEYGVFMSPDWPAPYEHLNRCLLYIFQAEKDHIVELTFDEFDLQKTNVGCDYSDHVRLYLHLQKPGLKLSDTWNTLLCGRYSDIEPTYYSSGSMLSFQFHTTSRISNATGFRGTFRFLNKALFRTDGKLMSNTQCDYVFRHDILARAQGLSNELQTNNRLMMVNGLNRRIHSAEPIWEFDDDNDNEYFKTASLIHSLETTFGPGTSVSAKGHFYSPQYPSTYPRHSRCLYRFQAKSGERVHLNFIDLSLDRNDESCHTSLDVVNVYDGVDTNSPLIGQICGTNYFVEFTSTGPEILVEFIAQGYIAEKGFRAEFAFISTIVPSSPPIDFWQHFPGPDNIASENNRTNSSPLLSSSSSSSPQSNSGQMTTDEGTINNVAVLSSPGTSGGGSCDFWFSSEVHLNGSFTSPRYPSPYPDNIVCRYHFLGGGKQRVQIIFRHFDIHRTDENARDCEMSDYLTAWVSTGGQQERIDSFCGTELPPRIMSNGASLTLEFNAKSRVWYRQQQRRKYHQHHHQNHHHQTQRSSRDNTQFSKSTNHHFRLRQAANHTSLQQSFDDHLSTESSVAAYQRFTNQLQKAQRLKNHQEDLGLIKTDSDTEFDNSGTEDKSGKARGFEAIYRFVTDFGIESGKQDSKSVCGFVFNSTDVSTGTFGSPNYPGLYPKDTECHYFFYGTQSEQVHIQFHHFDVEGVIPCTLETASDYLEFSSVHTSDRRPTRHCGVKHPPIIVSEGEFFRVTFKSNSRFDATGFQAVYAFRPRIEDHTLQQKKARSSLTTLIGSMSQAPETDSKNTISTPNPPRSGSVYCSKITTSIHVFTIVVLSAIVYFSFQS